MPGDAASGATYIKGALVSMDIFGDYLALTAALLVAAILVRLIVRERLSLAGLGLALILLANIIGVAMIVGWDGLPGNSWLWCLGCTLVGVLLLAMGKRKGGFLLRTHRNAKYWRGRRLD